MACDPAESTGLRLRRRRYSYPPANALSPGVSRRTLLRAEVGLVEDVSWQARHHEDSMEGFSPQFQVAFPYRGSFVWHVGRDDVFGDANQVLYVAGGEAYRMIVPPSGGYAEFIITPERSVLAEIAHVPENRLSTHPLFRRRGRRANHYLQALCARFLHWTSGAPVVDDLAGTELVLLCLRVALEDDAPRAQPTASTRRLIRRTKEFLEAELANPIRLTDVGRAVGASPAYLTDTFRHVEGVSLHRYLTQLRLARALHALPHTEDLAALALEIGFSSHSHFSAAFRRAFGCTPSEFRLRARSHRQPSAAMERWTPPARNRYVEPCSSAAMTR